MFRFLEDADLVEQERDDIHRILFSERKPACEFPFSDDASSSRPEDEAGCSSCDHRSSSESLRAETEVCSIDTRQSPTVSSTSTSMLDVRRPMPTHSGNSASKEHLNRLAVPPLYFDARKTDCQTNGNVHPSPLIPGYPTVGVIPPGAAACFSPHFGSQQAQMFPYGVMPPQWAYPVLPQYANPAVGHFLLPQVVPRHSASIPVSALRLSSTATATSPIYPPPMCGPTIYVPTHRPFIHNGDQICQTAQNIHYSMDSSAGNAMSYTGAAIIQEEISATLPRGNVYQRQNSNDCYQQQMISSDSGATDSASAYPQHDSAISPTYADEDERRQSCESPTIVIEADQNAAAIASRQRASALMNAASIPVAETAVPSSATAITTDTPTIAEANSLLTSSAPSNDDHVNDVPSTQSPQLHDNADGNRVDNTSSPSLQAPEGDRSGADIYYDAEDKSTLGISSTPSGAETDCSDKTPAISPPPKQNDTSTLAAHENEEAATTTTRSWASLLRNTPAANSAIIVTTFDSERSSYRKSDESAKQKNRTSPLDASRMQLGDVVSVDKDSAALKLAGALCNVEFINRGPTFVLRGILNRGNWCYVNASLQALMACPPFYHFLRGLWPVVQREHSSTPLLDAFVKFANEFPLMDRYGRVTNNRPLQPLDPTYLHSIITRLKSDATFKGKQEDAEEFLLQVFNVLHDEMVSCLSLLDKERPEPRSRERSVNGETEDMDNSEWHQVGPGRKAAVTRQAKYTQSPLSQLFLGQLRYGLSQPGAKESANLEPFYTLPLDVQPGNVKDIMTALQAFTSKENVKSFPGKNKAEVDATRRITFHELPRVLIFQLKYFIYSEEGGLKKILKQIDYPMDLVLDHNLLFNRGKTAAANARQYKLFAVVFHHGEKAEGGHYTVDIFHGGAWTHVDDTSIAQVGNDHVQSYKPPRVPYLLFYRRWDSDSQPR